MDMDALSGCTACGELGHEIHECKQLVMAAKQKLLATGRFSSSSSSNAPTETEPDFDVAGRRLLERMGVLPSAEAQQPCTRTCGCSCPLCDLSLVANSAAASDRERQFDTKYSDMNRIWQPASGSGGAVYVGSLQAATDLRQLRAEGITHVVNCMSRPSVNNFQDDGIAYLDFPIERWLPLHSGAHSLTTAWSSMQPSWRQRNLHSPTWMS